MRDIGLSDEDIRQLKFLMEARRDKSDGYTPHMKAKKPSESRCEVCNCRITETKTMGEVGHHHNCERRETRYKGRAGDLAPTPHNAQPDRELVADGGESDR